MPGIMVLSGIVSATNTDILQGTRLQTVPRNGWLSFELQAADADATNQYVASIQLPSGDTPLDSTLVPGNSTTAGVAGVLNERDALKLRFRVAQGGHCVFGLTETGDTEATWRVTFTPG